MGKEQAAEKQEGFISHNDKQVKVGKYFYTYSDGWHYSGIKENIGKLVFPKNEKIIYSFRLYAYKNYIYYVRLKKIGDYNYRASVWRMKPNGTGKEKIASIKENIGGGEIGVINHDYLLFVCSDGIDALHVHSINLKTGKQKKINQAMDFMTLPHQYKGIQKPCQYKQYVVAENLPNGELWYGDIWIYNTLKQNAIKVTDKAWGITIRKKYVYYIQQKGKKMCLMRCNMKAKQKKIVAAIKTVHRSPGRVGAYFDEITDRYCDICILDGSKRKYYRYDYKKKTCKKINK